MRPDEEEGDEADADRDDAPDDTEGDGDAVFNAGPDEIADGIESYAEGADGY